MSSLNSFSTSENMIRTVSEIPDKIIEKNTTDFLGKFKLLPFTFSHNLAGNSLFDLPRLAKLANTLISHQKSNVMCKIGEFPIHKKWAERPDRRDQVAAAIENIETSNSWLLLQNAQLDPEYKALMEQIITEVETLTSIPLRQEMTWLEAFIFVASPHTATPYHMDSEQNFIFQIHGEKEDNLFDRRDKSILTDQEIERFYMGEKECLVYREENQSKANVYHLTPGTGIYHPVNDPHWVKNGDSYCVSLTILFYLRDYDLRARVYQANHYLRRLGLNPTPPGKSAFLDTIKAGAIGIFSKKNPTTKNEVLMSGITQIHNILYHRLMFPYRVARGIFKKR